MPDQIYFTWIGDPNTPPVYLSTTGNLTDGTTVVTTGDLSQGSNIVSNIADVTPFVIGGSYQVSALGLTSGAVFTYGGGTSVSLSDGNGNAVDATLTGSAQLLITGNFATSSNQVTGVQGLDTLTTGRRYAAIGPDIAPGNAFTAPGPGVTTITLDLPVTVTVVNSPIVIEGPLSGPVPFDPAQHARVDEVIVGLEFQHNENEHPMLHLTIRNPMEGLLSPNREQWAWLSWDPGDGGGVIPLCCCKVHPAPEGMDGETIRLLLIAEPPDAAAQKQAIATALWKLPWVDPIFLSDSDLTTPNPDRVLEARSEDWHTDAVTLRVTTSDCLEGEDGTIVLDSTDIASQHPEYAVSVNYAQPTESAIELEIDIAYTQHGDGEVDCTQKMFDAFNQIGSAPYGYPTFSSLTGDKLLENFPKPHSNIGGGWTVSGDTEIRPITFDPDHRFTPNVDDFGMAVPFGTAQPKKLVAQYSIKDPTAGGNVSSFFVPQLAVHADFPLWTAALKKFALAYAAERKRTERARMVVPIDLQVTKPGAAPRKISLSSSQVGDAVDFGGGIPIGDSRVNSYFQTDRGFQTILHGLLQVRAAGRRSSRLVEIGVGGLRWSRSLLEQLSCRMNMTLIDRRMAMFGGSATGKIKSYTLTMDPSSGSRTVHVDFGCAVGNGGSVTPDPGQAGYIEEDYIDGYYARTGEQVAVGPDLFVQSPTDFVVNDDGVNMFDVSADQVMAVTVQTGLIQQAATALSGTGDPIARVQKNETQITINLLNMAGSFHTSFALLTSALKIPMGVNLAATA